MSASKLASPFLDEAVLGIAVEQVMAEPKNQPMPALAAQPRLRLQDSRGQPLAQTAWTLHQGGRSLSGTLDANGETAPLGTAALPFDATQPFRLRLRGMACYIVSGAVLEVADPAVEYGGSALDWKQAAGTDTAQRAAFWQEYDKVRTSAEASEKEDFLRHEHLTRRPIRLQSKLAVFEAHALRVKLGPIVRYTDERQAQIWLELATPALVRVVYGKAPNQSSLPGQNDAPGKTEARHAASVRIGGRHYAMVTLDGLQGDAVYQYRIELGACPATGALPDRETEFTEALFPRQAHPDRALAPIAFDNSSWFFLRTLPQKADGLRFAHGSCRKWPNDRAGADAGPGADMLEVFGASWLQSQPLSQWPRFFLHTGDQIYADDVGGELGARLVRQRRAATLPGPAPTKARDPAYGAWAGRYSWRYAPQDPARPDPAAAKALQTQRLQLRAQLVEPSLRYAEQAGKQQAAWDGMLKSMPSRPMGSKLRILNRLLWQVPIEADDVPVVDKQKGLTARRVYRFTSTQALRDIGMVQPSAVAPGGAHADVRVAHPAAGATGGVHAADYAEYAAVYEQAWSLPGTRRALAHLPTYMIFDDHDVTDDWNADRAWLQAIHTAQDPLAMWPTTICDALAAYWVYQGWGNLAPQAAAADPRTRVLVEARRSGRDALPALRRLLMEQAVAPSAQSADATKLLPWHYAVPTGGAPMLAVDLRTDRRVHGKGGLSPERLGWLARELGSTRSSVAFIVLPVPYLMPDPMMYPFRHPGFVGALANKDSTAQFRRHSDIEHPADNEVWNQIKGLIAQLQRQPTPLKTVVLLSGDVHFSCSLDGKVPGAQRGPRLLQLVASGLRQTISDEKQKQMASAYRGWLNNISGSTGADKHRGITITVGGLRNAKGQSDNFVYRTSFATVEVKQAAALPLITQTIHADAGGAKPEAWEMRHQALADGRARMTLHDPGPPRSQGNPPQPMGGGMPKPSPYPKVGADGQGVVQELEEEGEGVVELLCEGAEESEAFETIVLESEEPLAAEAADDETVVLEECCAPDAVLEADLEADLLEPESDRSEPEAITEHEVIGTDDRVRVADPFAVPQRWICALDLFVKHPQHGGIVQVPSRGTGLLIGPRYLLTAAHIFDDATLEVDGTERKLPVVRIRVSPARSGDNTKHPLGSAQSVRVYRRQPVRPEDDYALVVLDRDMSAATHKSMTGALGWWGAQPAVATVQRRDPMGLANQTATLIGYPGDRCGNDVITGRDAAEKERRIRHCVQRRADEWASTAWRSTGGLRPIANSGLLLHAADTYAGQSGAPLYFADGGVLQLLAVHGGPSSPQHNRAARVTRRMLDDLAGWINDHAGSTIAEVRGDRLQYLSATAAPVRATPECEVEAEL